MRRIGKILAVIGAVALVAGLLGTVMLVQAVRRGFSARDVPSALESRIAGLMRRWAVPAGERARKNPLEADAGVLAEARAHFADHCAICHANDGSGNVTIGKNLFPRAPDMRGGRSQAMTDGELFYTIKNGVRLTGMPAWGDSDSDGETWGLVAFIRHLPSLTPAEIAEMERLNPKSPGEAQEEADEEAFLKGAVPAARPAPEPAKPHTHSHKH